MQKAIFVLCAIVFSIIIFNACRPVKKVQKIETAIDKIDTTHAIVVTPVVKAVDSLHVVKDIIKNLANTRIDYKTFSAKIKFDYQGANDENHANAFIHMMKDSLIWVSITGPLNYEGVRLLVTKDSVKIINYLDHTYQFKTVSYLQELVDVPLSFYDLQDIIIGNPIFVDSNVVSYKSNASGLQVLMVGSLFKNLITLDKANLKVMHSKLDDVDPVRNRTCDITFSDYRTQSNINFSTNREITVAEKSKLDITLDFKQYSFNQPETFPFNIPRKYRKKQ
jgi:hypothetical protein